MYEWTITTTKAGSFGERVVSLEKIVKKSNNLNLVFEAKTCMRLLQIELFFRDFGSLLCKESTLAKHPLAWPNRTVLADHTGAKFTNFHLKCFDIFLSGAKFVVIF